MMLHRAILRLCSIHRLPCCGTGMLYCFEQPYARLFFQNNTIVWWQSLIHWS